MSVSTAELAASAAPNGRSRRRESLTPGLTGGRFYAVLIAVSLILGAISLAFPSTPSYDPWSWLVWGREILHLNLQTNGGPTWKPLPVIFTTVFAVFGKAAPDLWLVIARAGAVMAAAMVFKVAATIARLLVTPAAAADATANGHGAVGEHPVLSGRMVALLPALLGGAVAAVTFVFSGGFISDNVLGYSEGLMTACVLIAVERHLDGRPRQAFAIGLLAALDRPEIWLFWGPYGLWLFWRDPGARKLVIGLFVLIPILWFLPEYWGSGHFFRGVSRAHQPRSNSAAFASCPFCSELAKHAWPWVLLRVKVAAALGVAVAGWMLWQIHRQRGRWRLETPREHALAALIGAGLLGFGWFVLIAVMTQAGFSGNDRYLVLGAGLIDIAGGASFGWAAGALALALGRRGWSRLRPTGSVVIATGFMALVYALVPNNVGANLIDVPRTHGSLVYQARLRTDVDAAVNRLGRDRLLACGSIMTEGFQVPNVAYAMNVPMPRIAAAPLTRTPAPSAPNVIFQTRATRSAALLPKLSTWPTTSYRLVLRLKALKVYANCTGGMTL